MRVLFVTGPGVPDDALALQELVWLEPRFEVQTVQGASDALAQIRAGDAFRAVFLAPSLPHNEALALVASLRRDHTPVAVVAIITTEHLQFLPHAITTGADDVLLLGATGLISGEETLRRLQHSRHVEPAAGQARLRVLYAGQDEVAWNLLSELPFAHVEQTTCGPDGSCALLMSDQGDEGQSCDVLVVDENPGDAHALQVVKWASTRAPNVAVIMLTPATAGDLGGAALDLGADDVVSKAGTYRRRLIAALYRHFLRRVTGPRVVDAPGADLPEDGRLRLAEARIAQLTKEATVADQAIEALRKELGGQLEAQAAAASAADALAQLQVQHENVVEMQGFERALRDRDRAELASVRHALNEERERRIVLEETLRHTEDRAREELHAKDAAFAERERADANNRRRLEDQLAAAADRLHAVANETQMLHTRLEQQLAEQSAQRDRLTENSLAGYAQLHLDGRLERCSESFARMFGYTNAEELLQASADDPFAGLPDFAQVREQLEAHGTVACVESTAKRADGRPFRVLTSASQLPATADAPSYIERHVVDLSDRTTLEGQLRLARRLEAAGRLAAEMSPEIEAALPSLAAAAAPSAGESPRVITLVRQLLAFSRRQARPAGYISLNDAMARSERLLRQVAGDGIALEFHAGDIEAIAAGEDDVEQLLAEMVFAAAGCLPYGGALTLATAPSSSGLVLSTQLSVVAAGYGVQSIVVSPSLTRTVTRCGGIVHTGGDAGRTTSLHVVLPC